MPVTNPTRAVTPQLLASIASEAETLAACLLITPAYGSPVGFTTHDADVVFDGQTYRTEPGFTASEVAAVLGYSVDNLEFRSVVTDSVITREDLRGGRFDDATYKIFVCDHEQPAYGSMIVQTGTVGEHELRDDRFRVELRSLTQKLNRNAGELTAPLCRAEIFDTRCKLNELGSHPGLAIPYRYAGVAVTEVVSRFTFKFQITSHAVPANYFRDGLLVWEGGANAGQKSEVKTHTVSGSTHTVTLQEPTASAFAVGHVLRVRKGCAKTAAACQDVENMVNKRSEDYLPGLIETLRRP